MSFKTIILASSRDLRSCSLSSSVASCLWPVLGVAVVERLLSGLSEQGVEEVVVCSNGCGSVIDQTIDKSKCPDLTFLDEPFPVGTAGCIRQAVSDSVDDSLLVVFQGSMVSPPSINELISLHKEELSDMTVFFNPDDKACTDNDQSLVSSSHSTENAGIYVCSSSVLDHIPTEGYFDIKESLIPALLAAGKKVCHATLSKNVQIFRNRRQYLLASADAFNGLDDDGLKKHNGFDDIWVGRDVDIAVDVRLVGPVAVLDGSSVAPGSVVLGPTVIGRDVVVGTDSVVVNSIIWDGARIGSGSHISRSVIATNTIVEDNEVVEDSAVVLKGFGFLEGIMRNIFKSRGTK